MTATAEKQMEHVGLPAGQYRSQVTGVELVGPTGKHGWTLRFTVHVERSNRDVFTFRPLGDVEPYELSKSGRDGVRKFARRLELDGDGPIEEVVARLQALRGSFVLARMRPSKGGVQVTLFHDPDAPVVEVVDPAADYTPQTLAAQRAHELLVQGLHAANLGLAAAADACHRLITDEGWVALGYRSMRDYLASPEISISRSTFYGLAAIHNCYVLEGGIEATMLADAGTSKLEVPLPALRAGKVEAMEAFTDAKTLGLRDLREKYRSEPDPEPAPDPPVRPSACKHCGGVLEDDDVEDAERIHYQGHYWPVGWSNEMVLAAVAAAGLAS